MNEKTKILIADDNAEFARTLKSYIEKEEDMEVIGQARDGNEAVKLIEDIQPDIALLDVIMPHLDGLGVLEKTSELNISKKPTCIMLSAVGQDKITQRAIELGANYYVVKPFDINLLIKRIKEIKNYKVPQFRTGTQSREIKAPYIQDKQLGNGQVNISVEFEEHYYYEILSDMIGTPITGEYELIATLKELAGKRAEFESIGTACEQVEGRGYGIVTPTMEEIEIADPELIKHGNKYGVKIKAVCPSLHLIQANIETEIAPIVGSEEQAKDLIEYIESNSKENPDGIFDTNIFGKTIRQLVDDGIMNKVNRLTEESQVKLQDTIQKVVNDSNGGLVCIII